MRSIASERGRGRGGRDEGGERWKGGQRKKVRDRESGTEEGGRGGGRERWRDVSMGTKSLFSLQYVE